MLRLCHQADSKVLSRMYHPGDPQRADTLHCVGEELSLCVSRPILLPDGQKYAMSDRVRSDREGS